MKKLILLMLLLSPSFLTAQFNLDFSSGLIVSNLRQNSKIRKRLDSHTDLFLALSSHLSVSDRWSVAASLQYNTKGFDVGHDIWLIKQNSIDLLAELEYEIFPFLSFGPGLYISDKIEEQWNWEGEGWGPPLHGLDALNPFDVGASFKLRMCYKQWASYIRVTSSVRDITEMFYVGYIEEFRNPDLQLFQTVQVGLSYTLQID